MKNKIEEMITERKKHIHKWNFESVQISVVNYLNCIISENMF